jgi:hypothetical protein
VILGPGMVERLSQSETDSCDEDELFKELGE